MDTWIHGATVRVLPNAAMTRTTAAALTLAAIASGTPLAAQTPRPPAALFAASCATCHGQDGLGGHGSWVEPTRTAPRIARGWTTPNPYFEGRFKFTIRNGSYYGPGFMPAMPAFGREVISDVEMDALVGWLLYAPPLGGASTTTGVPPPAPPAGRAVVLEILDEAPWFRDDGTDLADPFGDRRRVVLSPGEYVKVVNRGRTWHTVSNPALGVDTGFVGWAGNIPQQATGYAYLDPQALPPGAHKYWCTMHPYMQCEITTPGATLSGLTRVSRQPIRPPAVQGLGELWVGLQTWPNQGGPNGAVEVIDASTWTTTLVRGVGNNPHNGWIGRARDTDGNLRDIAVFANWHDVTGTVLDVARKTVLGSVPLGAANAHVMTAPWPVRTPTGADRWFVTVMGSNKVAEIDPFADLPLGQATKASLSQSDGLNGRPAFSPHGLWFLDDGWHFVTANTYGASCSVWSLTRPWSDLGGRTGIGCEVANAATGGATPLAASVFGPAPGPGHPFVVYTNNAGSDDISVYRVDATPGAESITRLVVAPPLGNAAGNLALTDMMASPVRWAHMPIQCAVSPRDANSHRRFMVVCNKASLNVSVVSLDAGGMPTSVYTFPAGLGAHGVTFGYKQTPAPLPGQTRRIAYLAYVTNTFEDYVSVYDLELLEQLIVAEARGQAPAMFRPGGAGEVVLVSGHAPQTLLGLPAVLVPVTLFSPDARGLVHVGDVPLTKPWKPGPRCYLHEHVWIDALGLGMTPLDLDLATNTGAMGIVATPLPPPWR
jgi:mono/diheme cytochrome c family protein